MAGGRAVRGGAEPGPAGAAGPGTDRPAGGQGGQHLRGTVLRGNRGPAVDGNPVSAGRLNRRGRAHARMWSETRNDPGPSNPGSPPSCCVRVPATSSMASRTDPPRHTTAPRPHQGTGAARAYAHGSGVRDAVRLRDQGFGVKARLAHGPGGLPTGLRPARSGFASAVSRDESWFVRSRSNEVSWLCRAGGSCGCEPTLPTVWSNRHQR